MRHQINHRVLLFIFLSLLISLSACKYKKGGLYHVMLPGDSLQYVILDKGSGRNISRKAALLKLRHVYKGDICKVEYLSDSADLNNQKGVLLFNSTLPDIENDMLTKGFLGTLTSRQVVVYLLVSYQDFEKNFRRTENRIK
jgi:hypothetical protein